MNKLCTAAVAIILSGVTIGWSGNAPAQSPMDIKAVEEAQKAAETQIKAKLPWKIDEVTTMTDVEASGAVLSYWYLIATYKYKLKDDFIDLVQKATVGNVCKTEASLHSMKLGAVFRFIYFDARAKQPGTFDAKAADCG